MGDSGPCVDVAGPLGAEALADDTWSPFIAGMALASIHESGTADVCLDGLARLSQPGLLGILVWVANATGTGPEGVPELSISLGEADPQYWPEWPDALSMLRERVSGWYSANRGAAMACPSCNGTGCEPCGRTGLVPSRR